MTTKELVVRLQKYLPWVLAAATLILVLLSAWWVYVQAFQSTTTLRLGDGVFTANVVRTPAELAKGLSGTSKLSANEAMIFVFEQDDKHAMWMKDMNYPIDIVWLDSNKRVVHVAKNISPDTYPEEFASEKPARYVIELAAGTVEKKSINTQSTAHFSLEHIKGGEK